VQIEQHGSGYAVPGIDYEAFRLSTYKSSFLGRGRIALDVLFLVLCTVIFATDVLAVARHSRTLERHWWACAPPTSPAVTIHHVARNVLCGPARFQRHELLAL
jgi:hypothetical protein